MYYIFNNAKQHSLMFNSITLTSYGVAWFSKCLPFRKLSWIIIVTAALIRNSNRKFSDVLFLHFGEKQISERRCARKMNFEINLGITYC